MPEWAPDEFESAAEQVHEVYARYGLAMYFTQVLEHGIANFILASRLGGPIRTDSEVLALMDRLFRLTMGQQLREAVGELRLPEALTERMEKALLTRNFLVHDYFRARAGEFLSVEGRETMIAELNAMRRELEGTDDELEQITVGLLAERGVTEEILQRESERFRAAHGYKPPPSDTSVA